MRFLYPHWAQILSEYPPSIVENINIGNINFTYYKKTRREQIFFQAGYDLSSISFFQRGTAQEFITFTSRILTERTSLGARQSVKEAEYYCHVFSRADGLTGVCFSDHEYPPRVAHTLISRVLDDFAGIF